MREQAPQPQKPERALPRRKSVLGGVAVAAATALALLVPHGGKEAVDAQPAPASSSPTPEASTAAPTPTETTRPADTDIPEQLVEGRNKLQAEATNAALSVLRDMQQPNVGMTNEGLDNLTIGNPSDEPNHAPQMLATYIPAENLIHIRSITGNQSGEGGGSNAAGAAVDLEFQVTNDNSIASKTDQLTIEDFQSAIENTYHTTLLSATAKADGKWLSLSFDEHRVRATDLVDDPNNIYVIDKVDQYDTFARDLESTMKSAQDQLAAAAS